MPLDPLNPPLPRAGEHLRWGGLPAGAEAMVLAATAVRARSTVLVVTAESATAEEIDRPQVPFEFALQPAAGEGITIYGKAIQWRTIRAKDYFFDVNAILGGVHEQVAAYAVTYVIAPREITGVQLLMGSNDQGKVWLNGTAVVKSTDARSLEPDTDKAVNLTLKAGVNIVVFKLLNESNNWQGCLRFTDAAGQPLAGLTLKLAP